MNYTPHEVRKLAVEAKVDPRTATKWLKGEKVVSTVGACLEKAAKKLKMKADRSKPA